MTGFMEKLKPTVPRRVLIIVAGVTWCCVGVMMVTIGSSFLKAFDGRVWIFVASGLAVTWIFHHYLFLNIVQRNLDRISHLPAKPSVFSFIAWKSYLLIAFMIALGITLRRSPLPNQYLSIVYLGIGLALILSGFRYFRNYPDKSNTGN